MSLAERFGWFDVDAMLGSVSSAQVAEWMAYYELQRREEERAAEVKAKAAKAKQEAREHAGD